MCTIKNIVQSGVGSKPIVATTTETICHATAKDIDGYISANSKTSASGSGFGYMLKLTNIDCDKQ
ncbi:MAG: hypothetical protein EOP44_01295 [Sphingobacteriaceae bacterium]|nr:MAG: hypothetical protein EOP44_01295 [Sphingobacteriaceae bacterium]